MTDVLWAQQQPIRLPGSTLPEPAEPKGLEFTGRGGAFFRLVLAGAALQLVTFGFYRFWLVTDVRRHLWSRTRLDGDAFEYTGHGRELLVGFLFALAILSPIYLGYFLLGLEVERFKAFASIPLFLFFYVFQQFAVYRARRYRLTRTVWRGVRFWMAGSGWSYALRSSAWTLGVILTLGLLYPWRAAALERYKARHTFYGDLQADFTATGGELFARLWGLWLVFATPLALILASAAAQYRSGSRLEADPTAAALLGAASLSAPVLPFLWPLFRAIEWRWWVGGVRFGDLTAGSALRKRDIYALYLKFALSSALIVGLVVGLAAGAILLLTSATGLKADDFILMRGEAAGVAGAAAMLLLYLSVGLAVGVLQRYFLQRGLWRAVVGSTRLAGGAALEAVVAQGSAANALGEGLADGLDVAGF